MLLSWTQFALTALDGHPLGHNCHRDLEWQFMPTADDDQLTRYANLWPIQGEPRAHRLPARGDKAPQDADGPVAYHPNLIELVGTSWWNWRTGETEAAYLDFDHGHGSHGLDDAGIAQVDEWAATLPYVFSLTSKGGRGRGWVVPITPLPARLRANHARNCRAVRDHLCYALGVDLPTCAAPGSIQYLWARDMPPGGMQLLKAATEILTIDPPAPDPDPAPQAPGTWDGVHRAMFAVMMSAGYPVEHGEHDGRPMVRLHTRGLLHDFATNRRHGRYSTNSPGRNPSEPNCYAYPHEVPGALAVRRYNQANRYGRLAHRPQRLGLSRLQRTL